MRSHATLTSGITTATLWLAHGCTANWGLQARDVTHGELPPPVVAVVGSVARVVVNAGGWLRLHVEPDGVTLGSARVRCMQAGSAPGPWYPLDILEPRASYAYDPELTPPEPPECPRGGSSADWRFEIELSQVCLVDRCEKLRFSLGPAELRQGGAWP
jgi:hypothetical protein